MTDEKELVERLREARETIRDRVEESLWKEREGRETPYEIERMFERVAEGWADRFIVLRALKQRGDYAAFVDLTDEEDYLRWVFALQERQSATGEVADFSRSALYRHYIYDTFLGSDWTIDEHFPADLMDDIIALLNRPSLTAAWRSREESVREFIEQCAERAMLVNMDLLSPRRRKKSKETQHYLSF